VTEFTHAQFDEIGGMGKAIAQHAEAVFQAAATATEAGAQGRALAEQIITALVSTQGTRQPRVRDDLQAETGSPEAARAVVDYLVGERLLTVRSDPEDVTKSLVDLSHEALIQNWDRLRGWLAEDPQGRAMREEFRKAAEQWESGFAGVQPRSWFGLPGADVARNYLAWIDANKPRLSPVQQEFARAMRDMLVRLRRRRQLVMASLGVFALVSCILAIYAIEQADKARTNAATAEKNAGEARENETKAKAEEDKAKAEKRIALENAATLALEKGIQTCEEGRPRLGILAIAYSLQICPPDAHDLRRVILTNLAAWGPHLMCLDEVRTLPRETTAAESTGKYALIVKIADKLRADGVILIFEFQLFDIDKNATAGPPFRVQGIKSDDKFEFRSQIDRAKLLPSGMVLFTGGGYSSVWNAITGKPVGKWIHHGPGVAALSLDGKLVAGCNGQGDMRLYDAVSGVARDGVFQHMGKVNSVAFSADGRFVATGCGRRPDLSDKEHATAAGGVVHVYEVGATAAASEGVALLAGANTVPMTLTRLKWLPYRVPGIVTCVQISPDMQQVTGGGFELRSWSLDKGELIPGSTRRNPESTDYVEFDPKDPSSFIASNPSGSLQIMHSDDAIRLSGEQLSPQGWLAGVGFRSDGRVFTANGDGTVRFWNRPAQGNTAEKLGREFKPPKAESILCVAFHPKGTAIALGSRTGVVFVYDLDHPDAPPREFRCAFAKERRQPVTRVEFSTDGSRVIAHDQLLRTFVFETAGREEPLVAKNGIQPLGVADDGRTAVFRSRTANRYVIGQLDPAIEVPSGPILDPHGDLATITDEADNWFLVRAARAAFSPDRSLVALMNSEGLIYLFRTATGEPVGKPLEHEVEGRRDGMHSVEFSPHGDFLLTRSPRARGIWVASTGANINLLPNRIGIQVARFSPSGKFVVGGTNFSQGQAWTNTGRPAVPLPLGHGAQVWGVAVDATDERIITASFDHTARIWDRATGRPLSPPLTHKRAVSEATFSPDGKLALTGSWDGTARLWPVPRPLDDDEKRITAWVETMTGLRVEPNAGGELLSPEEWRARKAELDRLGGPPIDFGK